MEFNAFLTCWILLDFSNILLNFIRPRFAIMYFKISREVMDVPTNNVLTEEKAWSYFRDIVLGIEYCEYYEKLYPGFLCSLAIIASPSLENMAVVNHLC